MTHDLKQIVNPEALLIAEGFNRPADWVWAVTAGCERSVGWDERPIVPLWLVEDADGPQEA